MPAVRHRHVFYVSGFDPRGPAHYHRLYIGEAARQAAVTGFPVTVDGKRRPIGRRLHRWGIRGGVGPDQTVVTYDFVRWDDVVRAHWPPIGWSMMLHSLAEALFVALPFGYLSALKTVFPPFILAFLQPLFWFLGLLVATALAAALVFAGALMADLSLAAAVALAAVPIGVAALAAPRLNNRLEAAGSTLFWRTRIGRFVRRQAQNRTPLAEDCCDELAALIVAAADDPAVDEVLVVGHSVGSHLAVSAVARALVRRPGTGGRHAALSLLTLGQTTQMLSLMPEAARFRAEVLTVGSSDQVTWIDFSAPGDAACFALSDPVTSVGLTRPPGAPVQPLALSPRFVRLFGAERYAALKRDRMRMHFQYLMAADRPGPYDYFAITAGALTLGDRYPREVAPS